MNYGDHNFIRNYTTN